MSRKGRVLWSLTGGRSRRTERKVGPAGDKEWDEKQQGEEEVVEWRSEELSDVNMDRSPGDSSWALLQDLAAAQERVTAEQRAREEGIAKKNGRWTEEDLRGVNFNDLTEQILKDESAQALLRDLAAAQERVEAAKRAMQEIEQLEKDALAKRKSSLDNEALSRAEAELEDADLQVVKLEQDVLAAEAAVAAAERELVQARAGTSLPTAKWESLEIDDDRERIESVKTAAFAAVTGLLASLPFAVNRELSLLSIIFTEVVVAISCALFGITYRYAVRRDRDNIELKSGIVAAFGLVRGLAQLDSTVQLITSSPASQLQAGAFQEQLLKSGLEIGESIIVMAFAAAAIEICQQNGYLHPFPSHQSSKKSNS